MNVFEYEEETESFPAITPLLDVLLLILIFFMVTSSYGQMPRQLDFNLAESEVSSGPAVEPKRIYMNENGELRFQGQWNSIDKILPQLKKFKRDHPDRTILFSVEREVSFQRFIEIMSTLRREGISPSLEVVVPNTVS